MDWTVLLNWELVSIGIVERFGWLLDLISVSIVQ